MSPNGSSSHRDRPSIGEAALRGALAGVIGGLVLKLAWQAGEQTLPAGEQFGSPTRGAVDVLAKKADVQLSERERTAAAAGVYTGAMALWGAVFGAVQSRVHPPFLAHGLLLGGLVYAANFSRTAAALPKAGIVPAIGDQTDGQRAVSLGAHAVFGLATAAAYEALS